MQLETLVQWFESAESTSQDARALAERDRDYVDGNQLSEEETAELKKRGQPPVVNNRIKPKRDFILGMAIAKQTDPRALPRTPQHEQDADSITDAIRYVCDKEDFARKALDVMDNIIVEGCGGLEVTVKQKGDMIDIVLEDIPWDRQFVDPFSRKKDYADATYLGTVIWMNQQDALDRWPDAKEDLETAITNNGSVGSTYDDKPAWVDGKQKRIKVIKMYYKEKGTWYWCVFTKGAHIQEPAEVPFQGEDGNECPLILQSVFCNRENERYGVFREMIDIQDEINKRRSKMLHMLNSRTIIVDEGAVEDVNKLRREANRPDGVIVKNPGLQLEITSQLDLATGQAQLLQEAKAEIDSRGANAALAGTEQRNMSGRALLARQESGMNELALVFDAEKHFKLRVYRQIWNRIKQYWTEEMWVRVTDDEKNVKFVALNKPVTAGEIMQQQGGIPPGMENDPRLNQVVSVQNNVSELDIDIILDESPNSATLQGEQFEMLMQFATSVPGMIPPEVLFEASSIPNKTKILEKLAEFKNANAEQMQKQELLVTEKAVADIRKTNAEAEAKEASIIEPYALNRQQQNLGESRQYT